MQETTNYKLKKYEAADAPDLRTGYNASMDLLDTQLKAANNRIDQIPTPEALPEGLAAFMKAIGITSANATTLGTALNHFLNKTPAENSQYTTDMLANSKVTAEGYIFVPTTTNEA